jgi:hypothetical protein
MRFGIVPSIAEKARPWATTHIIGPPAGQEGEIGSLMAQVDEKGEFGRTFRVFLELDEGDLEKLTAGNPIELGIVARQMVPISIKVWGDK